VALELAVKDLRAETVLEIPNQTLERALQVAVLQQQQATLLQETRLLVVMERLLIQLGHQQLEQVQAVIMAAEAVATGVGQTVTTVQMVQEQVD
jgi:hypothetical protein